MSTKFRRYFEYSDSEEEDVETEPRLVIMSEGGEKHKKAEAPRCRLCLRESCFDFRCERCACCYRSGHQAGACPEAIHKPCSLCGSRGHSDTRKCPEAVFFKSIKSFATPTLCCLCGKAGHWTCAPFPGPQPLHCAACGERGHHMKKCPDSLLS